MAKDGETAGVVAFPPLIFGIPLVAGIIVDRVLSKRRLPPAVRLLAPGFFAVAVSLVVPALREFERAQTTYDVFEEATALIESGPFAHTRNPLYAAMTLAYFGTALATRSTLPFALLPAVLWVVNRGVVEREERHLEQKFGGAYRAYLRRVPRWI
ncbi:MAG TPA: isoprenylcysteine carboxylmethyltransferase family protein [Candidatus Baltobacteraceae bacterium]|nr:isoprenylcysteine carboxylmethyltransferase family protein [Candidatus Baltobacteraceae bacterium]